MAATVAGLTAIYGLVAVMLTHHFADRLRANPQVTRWMNRVAGTMLVGFGVKLALSR